MLKLLKYLNQQYKAVNLTLIWPGVIAISMGCVVFNSESCKGAAAKQDNARIITYFLEQVPEVKEIATARGSVKVEEGLEASNPLQPKKAYYRIKLGLKNTDSFYWDSFYVSQNFDEIMVKDTTNWQDEHLLSLTQWRNKLPNSELIKFMRTKRLAVSPLAYMVSSDLDLDGALEYVTMSHSDQAFVIRKTKAGYQKMGIIKSKLRRNHHFDGLQLVKLDKSNRRYIFITITGIRSNQGMGLCVARLNGKKLKKVYEDFPDEDGVGSKTLEDTDGDGIYQLVDYGRDPQAPHQVVAVFYRWNGQTFQKSGETVVITEVDAWKHPTKNVFGKYGMTITGVELWRQKTYPVFQVTHEADRTITNRQLLEEVAANNGFWDFKICDIQNYVEVYCDQHQRRIIRVVAGRN